MLTVFGVILTYLVFLFLLRLLTRKKQVQLSATELSLAFAFKVLLGCVYGYIYLTFYGGDDTWWFHRESIDEYHELFRDPALFFSDLSPIPSFRQADNFIQGVGAYTSNLEKQLLFKALALFNIFSRGNYYINVVFFNFIVFWGHYWLFSLLAKEFPGKRRPLLLLIFFFPPVVFWLSGIRADGLLLFFMALVLVHYHQWLQQRKGLSLLYTLLAMAGLFIFRNMMPLMLVPPMIAWLIAVKWKKNPWVVFATVYAITVVLFFSTTWFMPGGGLPSVVVKRQQEYFTLKGNTAFALDSLQASAGSFIKVLPQAVNNTFLRPFLWEAKDKLQLMASLDNMFLWGLIILLLVRKDEQLRQKWRHPLILFFLFFSISLYLFIGYTVPFPGAIIRYKAIAELCILLSLSVGIKWGGNTTHYK